MWLQYLIRRGLWGGGQMGLEALEEEEDEEIEKEKGGWGWGKESMMDGTGKHFSTNVLWKQDEDMRCAGAASTLRYRWAIHHAWHLAATWIGGVWWPHPGNANLSYLKLWLNITESRLVNKDETTCTYSAELKTTNQPCSRFCLLRRFHVCHFLFVYSATHCF